jgi:D-alanyl-lipoteichoic acid acyltransferase DltB (MBOAT superfamily)
MLFNSLQFLVFFQALLGVFFVIPPAHRWRLLLVASIYFYMCWNPYYIFLLLFSVTIDYVTAIAIEGAQSKFARKLLLGLSLSCNLGLLFYFKYYNFFLTSLNTMLGTGFSLLDILLPVGISFYTFQSISYTIDVYRGELKPQKSYGRFLLFVMFFPQLVAGPIERAGHLMPQLFQRTTFDIKRIASGYTKIIWGLFLKMVIADRAGEYVNLVYGSTDLYNASQVSVAIFLFTIQIYCDFLGYSTIAVGAAEAFGIKLMWNFRQPFFSRSIIAFWRRWHISLSTWFRDYVYIPLGGSRNSAIARSRNLLLTFILSGIWHGAKFTMLIWGFYHGVLVVLQTLFKSKEREEKTPGLFGRIAGGVVTFLLVVLGFAIFRSADANQMILIFSKIFDLSSYATTGINIFEQSFDAFILFPGIIALICVDLWEIKRKQFWLNTVVKPVRYMFIVLLIAAVILFGKFETVDFIYFQF